MPTSSIIAKIGLNSAGFKTGLAQCKAAATQFKNSVGGIFSGIGNQILGTLGISMGVAGLGLLSQKAIDTGSKISDTASHLRIGTTELQALQSAARDAGVDLSKFEMALNNLNLRTVEAADGNQNYRDAFERLGISLKNFTTLSTERKLESLAKAYQRSGESITALNDVSTLLGQKAGSQLLEVLNLLATDGMDKLTQSAIAAGDVMDEETVAALDRAGDEIGRWQNRIIVAFGGFLADMGSAIGRQKWGLMIGMKFAQAGEFIENTFRNISNYILSAFSSVFRYINGQFAGVVIPIRNVFTGFLETLGKALAKFASLFSDSFAHAVERSVESLKRLKDEANKMARNDKGKGFGELFGEEMQKAETANSARKRDSLWTAKLGSVDWYKEQLEYVEKARDAEKQLAVETDKARKEKYSKSDRDIEIKETTKGKKAKMDAKNDTYLARIGGGGLTAARFDVGEKQLGEAKKHSKLLEKIAENTGKNTHLSDFLMR